MFQPLFARVYVNLLEGNSCLVHCRTLTLQPVTVVEPELLFLEIEAAPNT